MQPTGSATMGERKGGPLRWSPPPIHIGASYFDYARAYVVGILNVTPDSFSDGGQFDAVPLACARARELARQGADIVDIGGESTRPGAAAVGAAEEIARVVPVIEGLRELGVPISIDTTKADVAEAALLAGATIINDISGGSFDARIIDVAHRSDAVYVLGHLRGNSISQVHEAVEPEPTADDVREELGRKLDEFPPALRKRTIVDPGLGFGKTGDLNLELTRNSGTLAAALQCPVMIGPSRKRYLGALTGRSAADRDDETIGAALAGVRCGAHFVRVHASERVKAALVAFEASGGVQR